jgi:hypothetical protein
MRKIATDIVAPRRAQADAGGESRNASGAQLSGGLKRESPTELVCLALVLALVTLAGRILTTW